jgi:hypothetical protein
VLSSEEPRPPLAAAKDKDDVAALMKLALGSPRNAIIESWRLLQDLLVEVAKRKGPQFPVPAGRCALRPKRGIFPPQPEAHPGQRRGRRPESVGHPRQGQRQSGLQPVGGRRGAVRPLQRLGEGGSRKDFVRAAVKARPAIQ